jgi:hypothetical protein
LQVYLTDAESFWKGSAYFWSSFRVNAIGRSNNLYVAHQFNYENKFFSTSNGWSAVGSGTINRFGDSYALSDIADQTRYNKMYNKAGLVYENTSLGKFQFYRWLQVIIITIKF